MTTPPWARWAVVVALLVVVGIAAPVLAPHDPQLPAGPALAPPSTEHLLGTNNLGQDILSRVLWGARTSLAVAATAAVVAVGLGTLVGVTAGLIGGWTDTVAMRVVDIVIAIPRLPLLVLVAALVGAAGSVVAVLIGLLAWASIARVLRAQTRSLRGRGYVSAARGFGAGTRYLLRRHVVPSLSPLLVAETVMVAGSAILVEAGLAFLGLADPTRVSWGLDINRALAEPGVYLTTAWLWWVLPTGLVIVATVLSITMLGAALDRVLNPRAERWT